MKAIILANKNQQKNRESLSVFFVDFPIILVKLEKILFTE